MSTVLAYALGQCIWHPGGVEQSEAAADLTKAAKAYRRTEKAHDEARQALKEAAVAALAAGVKQSEVVRTTGWTREYLRRLRKKTD
jgi:hypothetical protein